MNFAMAATLVSLILAAFISQVSSKFDSTNTSVAAGCQMLYKQLETALLEPTNLYILRQSFFPNLRTQPNVLPIEYACTLIFDANISKPCAGSGAENQMEEFECNGNKTYKLFWTNSAALSIIDPRLLDYLQSILLYLYNPITTDQRYGALSYVRLQINIENLSCIPSQQQLTDGLDDLSTMLKAYANAQGSLQSWDSQHRGYISDRTDPLFSIFTIAIPVILLVITVTVVVAKVALLKTFHVKVMEKIESNKENPYYGLFLSAYIIIVFSNLLFTFAECTGAIIWLSGDEDAKLAVSLKLVFFLISILLGILAAVITTRLGVITDFRLPLPDTGFHVSTLYICYLCKKVRQFAKGSHGQENPGSQGNHTGNGSQDCIARMLIVLNVEIFAVLITWNLVPVALLIFIHPVITAAGVSFMVSLYWLTPILLALLFRSLDSNQKKTAYKWLHIFINMFIISSVVWVAVTWIAAYQKIAGRGVDTGGAVMFAVAFLPAIVVAVAGLGGNRLLHKLNLPLDSQNEGPTMSLSRKPNRKIKININATVDEPRAQENVTLNYTLVPSNEEHSATEGVANTMQSDETYDNETI